MRKESGQVTSANAMTSTDRDSDSVLPAQLMPRCPACGQPEALSGFMDTGSAHIVI